jgi:hypothetical protein
VKARSWRWIALDSHFARREVKGRAVRDVKFRADTEGGMLRYWLVVVGTRRARRPQRAMMQAVKQLLSYRALRTPSDEREDNERANLSRSRAIGG